MKPFLRIPDIAIILLAAGLVVFSVYAAYIKPQGRVRVLLQGHDSEWIFQINAEETVIINGPLGDTVVKIHDNRAWVESSPCENQSCVASGFVWRQGQWAACLPNKVLLIIEGNNEQEVDAVVW
jgi:hypothetical protein